MIVAFSFSCDEDSASDYVEFSNFNTRDRKYVLYCGHWRELSVRSDGRYFRITMASNDRLDGTGFRALYNFETAQQQQQQVTTEQNAMAAKSASGKVMSSAASRLQRKHLPNTPFPSTTKPIILCILSCMLLGVKRFIFY